TKSSFARFCDTNRSKGCVFRTLLYRNFDRNRGFDREAVRKTLFFDSLRKPQSAAFFFAFVGV
ncbi:hypothetical protein, partial [Agathobaculum sp.]|uniref:hypothetical protein n=1 Tax=Agathobaculum sp. TaxID=2048138 RepID=UPI0027B9A035